MQTIIAAGACVALGALYTACATTTLIETTLIETATQKPPRQRVRRAANFVCCYKNTLKRRETKSFDLIIASAELTPPPQSLCNDDQTIVAYLSVGELASTDPAWPRFSNSSVLVAPNPNWTSAWRVDVCSSRWRDFIVERAGNLLARGFDGVFLDTADVAGYLEPSHPGSLEALRRLIETLRNTFPRAVIGLNQGLALYPGIRWTLDFAVAEGLFARYDFATQSYKRAVINQWEEERLKHFAKLARSGLPVLSVEYAPPSAVELVDYALAGCRRYGFIPYVGTLWLNDVRTDTLGSP